MSQPIKLSVIVPARDAAGTLPACLEALADQTLSEAVEMIVVDDGSKDDTASVAGRYGAICVSISPAGPAAARNFGARQARGELLLFTDADCVPAPTWAAALSAVFCDPAVAGARGVYRTREHGLVPRFVQLEYSSKYERIMRSETIDFVDTYSAAYRHDVFMANGGFEVAFPTPSVEDQEFSFRLARKGYKLVFAPDAVVYHRHDLTLAEYVKRKYWIGYWKAFLLRRHPEKAFRDSHTPASQRLQIALLGGAGICIGLGWISSFFLAASIPLIALFVLSALPFLTFIFRYDRKVLLAAPGLLVARAAALGAGLMAGFLDLRRRRLGRQGVLSVSQMVIKRSMDIVGAATGLILFSPWMLLFGALVRLDSPGPTFFVQERVGENGRRFRMVKLRSMRVSAEREFALAVALNPLPGPAVKVPGDPRVTPVGAWLRRWSLDELPQLWNVLRGEMSLVGPRPEEVGVVDQYSDWHRQRLLVRPGMTGPMQINGRGLLSLDERVRLELEYIQNYSIWRDVDILIKTIPAVVSGNGAY